MSLNTNTEVLTLCLCFDSVFWRLLSTYTTSQKFHLHNLLFSKKKHTICLYRNPAKDQDMFTLLELEIMILMEMIKTVKKKKKGLLNSYEKILHIVRMHILKLSLLQMINVDICFY